MEERSRTRRKKDRMTPERWSQIRSLVERAVALPPKERSAFLHSETSDASLIAEVEEHLAYDRQASAMFSVESWQQRAQRTAAETNLDGTILGSYRVLEEVGRGGMGAVYSAERADGVYQQRVALKILQESTFTPSMAERFRRERQILARLQHPGIARLLDGGVMPDGRPYLVLEYIDGERLDRYCDTKHLDVDARLRLFLKVAEVVQSAHQHLVLHLDLKPANILVTPEGTPKLLDFGIAKVLNPALSHWAEAQTEPGTLKLTARYASPEQVRGEPVTTASDVYSLGVILYELLSGHSPYGATDRATHQILHAVCEEVPAKPSTWTSGLKGDLDNIVLRALRKAPFERYASADQLSEDILRYLQGRPVLARGDAPVYVAAKFIRRNRVVVSVAGLLLCSLIVGLVEVTRARSRAERRFNEVRQLAHSVMFDYADAIDRLPGATPVRAQLVKDALTYLDNLSKEADTPQLQKEIVDAYVRVSNVQGNEYENNLGDTKAAMASAHKAVDAAEKLLKEDQSPAAQSSAASAFSTYGSLLYSTGDLQSADRAYQRALGLYRKIAAASPQDLDDQVSLITCLRHLGDLYGGYGFRNLGKITEGLAYYEQAKSLVLTLVAQFPSNLDLTKESYKTLLSLTAAEAAAGKHDEAAKDLEEALAQIQRVSIAEPADTNVKVELAIGESRLGQMQLDDRDFTDAVLHETIAEADGCRSEKRHLSPGPIHRADAVGSGAARRGSGRIRCSA